MRGLSEFPFEQDVAAARARRRARRRRMYRLRQRLIELAVLLVLVALIATPIWLIKSCRSTPPAEPIPNAGVSDVSETESAPPMPYPEVDSMTVSFPGTVDAPHALLWDLTEERVVASRSASARVYPASVTKVMTLLVAVENIVDFTDTFTMTYEILHPLYLEDATIAGFMEGEKVLLEDMLYGCILPSGADATQGLAEYISGTEAAFVELMNAKAIELGLKDTHFVNTSGLHDPNHYTTAADMAVVMAAAMANHHCRQVLSTVSYTTAATPEHPEGIPLYSTMFSRMYGTEPGSATILAGKTGYTSEAKHTMVSYAEGKNGHEYILVTMYGTSKWKATFDAINVYKEFCPVPTTTAPPTTTATTTKDPAA